MAEEQTELPIDIELEDALDLVDSMADEDLPRRRWPKQLAKLMDVLVALYVRRGRTKEEAIIEAREIVLAMALYQGGRPLYLAKGAALEAALRDARIWHSFNGRNTHELADETGLTLRQVQKVIKSQMRYRRGLRQGSLPI